MRKQSNGLSEGELAELLGARELKGDLFYNKLAASGFVKRFEDLSRKHGIPLSTISEAASNGKTWWGIKFWKKERISQAVEEYLKLRQTYKVFERIITSIEPKIYCAPVYTYAATAAPFAVKTSSTQFVLTSTHPYQTSDQIISAWDESIKSVKPVKGTFHLP